MTTAELDAILERLATVASDVDLVHTYVLHGNLELPFSTVAGYMNEVKSQAEAMLRCVSLEDAPFLEVPEV